MTGFPWLMHRSLAEVAETGRLRDLAQIHGIERPTDMSRLESLTARERAANPPTPRPGGSAA